MTMSNDKSNSANLSTLAAWQCRTRARVERVRLRVAALRARVRSSVRRHLVSEGRHLFALTLLVGVVCGLVAVAFHLAIRAAESLLIERAMHAPGSTWMVWTVVSPTLGGLLGGAALTYIVPGARGSGIPQVKQAFAVEGGRIRFRDAFGKFIIGALQIGSGASLGREGPTVQICAGATSLLARATSLPPRNMRRLTPVGVAAGIAAAFNAPIAAVTFTIEEIVGALDQTVLSGVVIAAALAAVIERGILGVHPVIEVVQAYGLDHASSLPLYALLGVAASMVSVAFTDGLLKLRLWFRNSRAVPLWTQPAIGGLVTGLLAVLVLRFLGTSGLTGGGYETLGHALAGQLGTRVLLVLCAGKLVATVFSYSSGGAGGIFAPALFMGAMVGGAIGHLDVALLDHESRQLGAFALVGMGAVFAGVIRAPITSVLIIFEMTGGYGLVLPLMLANTTAYVLARRMRPTPIYEALLEQDGVVLPHSAPAVPALEQLLVSDAMTTDVVTAQPLLSLDEASRLVSERSFAGLPVIDGNGMVLGVAPTAELRARAAGSDRANPITTLLNAGHTIRSDATLLSAVVRMNDLGVRQLLVVDPATEPRLVGILAMSDLARAQTKTASAPARMSGSTRPIPPSELAAASLMYPAAVVPATTNVGELEALLRDAQAQALIVRYEGGDLGVILPESLHDFDRDKELQRMLIAGDVARAAPSLSQRTDLAELIKTISDGAAEAAIVLNPATSEPVGVVTKHALALALLEWHARRPSSLPRAVRHALTRDAPAR
jgi:chloride channel protein, CIC family